MYPLPEGIWQSGYRALVVIAFYSFIFAHFPAVCSPLKIYRQIAAGK